MTDDTSGIEQFALGLNATETLDDAIGLLYDTAPPAERLHAVHLREVIVEVLKARGARSPARIADAWLDSGKGEADMGDLDGGPSMRDPVFEAPALAHELDIVKCFAEGMGKLGHAGEGRLAQLVYLSTTSRLLSGVVSVAVKGTIRERQELHGRSRVAVCPRRRRDQAVGAVRALPRV